MTVLRLNSAEIAYDIAGDGEPVVLIHAGVADRRMWTASRDALAARRRVICYDTRGYGETYVRKPGPYSNRRDIIDLLDHLGIDRAALVGVSRGATIAIDTALEFPDRIRAVVSVGPGLSGFDGGATSAEQAAFEEMERLEEARNWDALSELEAQFWVDGPGQPSDRIPDVHRRAREMIIHAYCDHADEPLEDVTPLQPPAAGRLDELRVPVLVVVGDLDTSGTIATARRIVDGVPDARQVQMSGVAHLQPMERPDEFARIVEGFLDSIEA